MEPSFNKLCTDQKKIAGGPDSPDNPLPPPRSAHVSAYGGGEGEEVLD